jgi:hypothetical protein
LAFLGIAGCCETASWLELRRVRDGLRYLVECDSGCCVEFEAISWCSDIALKLNAMPATCAIIRGFDRQHDAP